MTAQSQTTMFQYGVRPVPPKKIKKIKIPLEFVREVLSCKGRYSLLMVDCFCGEILDDFSHYIRWLYNHAKAGHNPGILTGFSWDRQEGRDTGMFVLSCRTKQFRFYDGHFELIETEDHEEEVYR